MAEISLWSGINDIVAKEITAEKVTEKQQAKVKRRAIETYIKTNREKGKIIKISLFVLLLN